MRPRFLRASFATALALPLLLGAVPFGSGLAARAPAAYAEDVGDADISLFYDTLAPFGDWDDVQPYGSVFVPEVDPGWRPYTMGRWAWSDEYGWVWVSDDPWGWVTDHYGRWTYLDDIGWAWVPGSVWGPAWVSFRASDDYIGWAPLPPFPGYRFDLDFDAARVNAEVAVSPWAWVFVPTASFADPSIASREVVTSYNPVLLRATHPSTRFTASGGRIVNQSVDVTTVEKARGAPVPRLRVNEMTTIDRKGLRDLRTKVEGNTLILPKPKIVPRASGAPPLAPPKITPRPGTPSIDEWFQGRKKALENHLDTQKKALDQYVPPQHLPGPPPTAPGTPGAVPGEDGRGRRDALQQNWEQERKRMNDLLERQRQRRERMFAPTPPQPPTQPPPPKEKKDK